MPAASSPIVVLGMHRSGTSCLTGLLEDAGVYLGDVQKKNPHNLKGNQESLAVMALHEDVLADNDATWDAPPPGGCRWMPERRAQLDAILASYPADRVWAMKDPRSCFTLSAWLDARPDMRIVGTFRHPIAVAASLLRRDACLDITRGVEIWCRYNLRLIELQDRFGFPIVCFDLASEDYLQQISDVFSSLDLSLPTAKASFFDAELRRNKPDRLDDPEAEDLYARLRRLAGC